MELAYGHGNVAAVLEARSDLDGARRELELAQQIKEDLARRKPDDRQRLDSVATGHNRIGVVLDKAGDTEAAFRHFEADLKIRRELVERDPRNVAIRRSLGVAYTFLARAHEDRGELAAAEKNMRQALAVSEESSAIDRRNLDWQRDVGRVQVVLADVLRWQRHTREAASLSAIAVAASCGRLPRPRDTQAARQRDLPPRKSLPAGSRWREEMRRWPPARRKPSRLCSLRWSPGAPIAMLPALQPRPGFSQRTRRSGEAGPKKGDGRPRGRVGAGAEDRTGRKADVGDAGTRVADARPRRRGAADPCASARAVLPPSVADDVGERQDVLMC